MEINESVIEAKINAIDSYIDDINKELKKLEDVMTELGKGWDGVDAKHFYTEFGTNYTLKLVDLKNNLKKFKNYLSKAVDSYKALDDDYSSRRIEV